MTPATALDIAQALVRIPSVNPDYDPASAGEGAVTAWIEDWGKANGFTVWGQPVLPGRDNILLQFRSGADHPHFMLNGHTDTVGVGGMTIAPFGGEVRDGRLWGRGASDMKGPLACMMAAALRLKNAPSTWRGTLTVACVADEEFRFRGVSAMLDQMCTEPVPAASSRRPDETNASDGDCKSPARLPDFAVVGEPTRLRVVRGCKGCLRFAIHAVGHAAHSSKPHEGRSAVVAMAHAILELERHFATRLAQIAAPGFGTSTGSIGLITGGTGVNIVPERCTIQVDIRLLPGQDGLATHQEIQTLLRERCRQVPDVRWVLPEPSVVDPSFEFPADHPLVKTACAVLHQPAPDVVFFGCDASKLAARGVPVIVLGPGDIAQAHTVDEFIALADLEAGTEAYVRLAQALMPPP
ncbi:MAG: acetylornithine deacetylase [Limisphaerales bacterium]|nr:MAG: acetylornithine deacetylase [Limisphaerales bacterium]TXT46425.1 MAG: acetylornithine deacetylase [Limisphaerales bacterium]